MIKIIRHYFNRFINKKYKIILIRHGESEGNLNPELYMKIPDHKIKLTKKGIEQSKTVGKILKKIVKESPLDVFVSPYTRTKETWEGILEGLARNNINLEYDPRLREQQHTIFRSSEHRREKFKEQREFSKFFYRFGKGGESGADVFSRVSTFLTELRIDRRLFYHENNCIIVAHEIALRSILMKLYKLDSEEFDKIPDIENCSPVILETYDFKTAKINSELTLGNRQLVKFFNLK